MSIEIELPAKVAIVTGALGGIGSAIVERLEKAGALVVQLDLSQESSGGKHVQCDVTDEESVRQAASRVLDEHGAASIVVNNAGVMGPLGMPFTKLSASDWDACWAVNVVGTFNVSAAFAPSMPSSENASIINIASVSGRTGFQTSPPYSASKAAVINFTQAMARDLASRGIRVNAVCPGMVFTPFYRAVRLAASESDLTLGNVSDEEYFQRKATSLVPLGRGQEAEDIANAVLFLASPMAKNITGQTLNVDGGLVMS